MSEVQDEFPVPPSDPSLAAAVAPPPPPFLRRNLGTLVTLHVALMLLFASWVFGGNIWWARNWLALWSALGPFLTVLALTQPGVPGREARQRAWVLLPWTLFGLLVVASSFNPSFIPRTMDGQPVLINMGAEHPSLPSTVSPVVSLHAWAFGGGAWLAACNLWLAVTSRRTLRLLLAGAALNTLVLAVLGTLQKLLVPTVIDDTGYYSGFYFGWVRSPQKRFFGTFIYNNHWGAFMILFLAVAIGLLFHYDHTHRPDARDRWHTPLPAAIAAALFIAVSAPMSASRAATIMAAVLVLLALRRLVRGITAARREQARSAAPVLAAVLVGALVAAAAVVWLARTPLETRLHETQLAMDEGQLLGARPALYRDTWTLAMQEPLFGWGLGNFGTAFQLIRPRPVALNRQHEQSFVEAHSDWLQSLAENGFVGTALLILLGLLPLCWLSRDALRHPLVSWPLLGCAFVLMYAWVEFPFGNGAVLIGFWIVFFAALRYAQLLPRSHTHE